MIPVNYIRIVNQCACWKYIATSSAVDGPRRTVLQVGSKLSIVCQHITCHFYEFLRCVGGGGSTITLAKWLMCTNRSNIMVFVAFPTIVVKKPFNVVMFVAEKNMLVFMTFFTFVLACTAFIIENETQLLLILLWISNNKQYIFLLILHHLYILVHCDVLH